MITTKWDRDPNESLRELLGNLRQKEINIRQVPEAAVRRGSFELLSIIQQLTPKKTATLVRSLHVAITNPQEGTIEGQVGTSLKYAPFIESGTGMYGPMGRPVVVVAKRRKALFWGSYNASGKPIMSRSVSILGVKPVAPFGRGFAQFTPRYEELIQQELAKGIGD